MATILTMAGGFLFLCGLIFFVLIFAPLIFAAFMDDGYHETDRLKDELARARAAKIRADQEVLESRRAKIDSEVANLELKNEALRSKLGYPPANNDNKFTPINYDTNHN